MALKPLLSFSSGELDPILHDNVTLEKFNKGLETARNVIISKTGSITSRFPRAHFKNAKLSNRPIRLFSIPHTGILLEFGPSVAADGYIRIHFPDGSVGETTHSLNWTQLKSAHIVCSDAVSLGYSGTIVYIFVNGENTLCLNFTDSSLIQWISNPFFIYPQVQMIDVSSSGTPAGYEVDYLVTAVVDGQETLPLKDSESPKAKKPIATGQVNTIAVNFDVGDYSKQVSEIRIYSRPSAGGAFGYLGSITEFISLGSGVYGATFVDQGQLPDYTNGVPDIVTNYGLNNRAIADLKSNTGIIYQQRLIITDYLNKSVLAASRPGQYNNFYRDFPYSADSALLFKTGSVGRSEIICMIESDGLIVFTTTGVFISVGLLGPNNILLDKKGSWVIKDDVPPLLVPGGVFFVDQNDTVRQLIFSQDIMAYESMEQSIFSNHLFRERVIKSWTYQEGNFPLIIVTFSDGTWATFTYNYEHQMKAWTRHDGVYPIEQVEGTGLSDATYFVVNKNGQRQIEVSLPRYTPNDVIVEDPDSVMKAPNALMDGMTTKFMLIDPVVWNELPANSQKIVVTPVTPDDWSGYLQFTVVNGLGVPQEDNSYIFMDPTDAVCTSTPAADSCQYALGVPGAVMRWFNPVDHSYMDFTVVSRIDNGTVIVEPSQEFPSKYADNFKPYVTFNEIDGLDHLEGEKVSLVVDGSVVSSPNDVEGYPTITVTGGKITLPDGARGSIFMVGRPVIADVETLNMSTVEQSPVTLESLTVNKLYVRVFKTKGLYVGAIFPETKYEEKDGSSVKGMESLDKRLVPDYNPLLGNVYAKPLTMRIEKTLPGSWRSQGKICFRQVDPLHFEILSIIPDVEISRRSDR